MNGTFRALLVCALVAAIMPAAHAFFPFGGSPVDQFQLRFLRWSFEDIDTNGDGDVSGEDGIDITFEGGPTGWTDEEIEVLEDAFDVWENISTSYIAFRYTLPLEDPAGFGDADATSLFIDGINLVLVQTGEEPAGLIDANLAAPGVLGIAFIQFVIDDGFFQTPDGMITFPVTGGRLLEADIGFDAAEIRSLEVGTDPNASLFGTAVHEIGHFIGLGHNPMNNLELTPTGELIESPVFALRNANGVLETVGVTPTMFPNLFQVDDGTGELVDGGNDLAMDDIAGATFLYPRDSGLQNFFTITQEARTQARPGFPTVPILGGLVTAWVEHDDDPATPRLPLISTMTGLYQYRTDVLERGRFELRGLPKVIEVAGTGAQVNATYTLTIEPLNGLRVPGQGPDVVDTTHGFIPGSEWEGVDYDTVFQSEVFHRDGGFFGRDNFDAGTPVMWDAARNVVVLANTGETLEEVLERDEPMFGDASDICPLLVIEQAAGVVIGPSLLRGLRDEWLLQTPVGAAAVEAYYQAAPAMAAFLMQHDGLRWTFVQAALGAEWALLHPRTFGLAALLVAALGFGAARLRTRHGRKLIAGLFVGAVVFGSGISSAHAVLRYMTDEEKAEVSDAIVQGTVTMVETRQNTQGNVSTIITDTFIEVQEGMKGDLNQDSGVSLSTPGGRVGNIITHANELPRFQEGEEVVLYLFFVEGHGYVVTAGIQGKVRILTNATTGQKFVEGSSFPEHQPSDAEKKSGLTSKQVSLDDYKAAIRESVRKSKSAQR